MRVLVHGGAGDRPDDPDAQRAVLETAASHGSDVATPITAVCRAVGHLESAPGFNAGVGSAVQSDGTIRTDAGVMVGDGTAGAACAMRGVEHAVDVARVVARETPHILLAGQGARDLAGAIGVATDCDLWTERTRERWAAADPPVEPTSAAHREWVREHFGGTDTVGAVATDGETVAAATSTGGRWFALRGRVGDVPQVGAGFFAGERAAASATGHGEAIARFGLARRVVEAVASGSDPASAAAAEIEAFDRATDATAGVIVAARTGATGSAHNATLLTAERAPT
jgi:beta-aspartyl-peptidase (threonine type)